MRNVVVRYGELGSKSNPVHGKMVKVLRERVEAFLKFEGFEYGKVRTIEGRIIVEECDAVKVAEELSMLPGISSTSPAYKTSTGMEDIKEAVKEIETGETFGVRANSAVNETGSNEIERRVGSFIEEMKGSSVDLDEPDTWIRIDLRKEAAFVFSERFQGPDGFPVGTEGKLAALISGGIDSPVAAYEAMTRGASITPIYFYNKPFAAEDHKMRFVSTVKKLKRFHPSKKGNVFIVDMEEVNERLMEIDRGRMVVHRKLMFEVAQRIALENGMEGLVTGESIGQKSSQTPRNLRMTAPDVPVHRPLLTLPKSEITSKARKLGTFEDAKIDSACRTMAPDRPRTKASNGEIERLKEEVGFEQLVEKAFDSIEKEKI